MSGLNGPQRNELLPQERWEDRGFLPHMPDSLEQLDLLLLTVAKTRRVQQDGIRFQGHRYIDPTLAAYVKEDVLIRYDPADLAEIRVFYQDRFLCRAICQELAGQTISLFVHPFQVLSEEETRWLLQQRWNDLGREVRAEDFTDQEAISAIVRITGGSFRLIHRLLMQIDRILEINKLHVITKEVVETARENLVIGQA